MTASPFSRERLTEDVLKEWQGRLLDDLSRIFPVCLKRELSENGE
jgi:hypothetical protein